MTSTRMVTFSPSAMAAEDEELGETDATSCHILMYMKVYIVVFRCFSIMKFEYNSKTCMGTSNSMEEFRNRILIQY